MKISYYFTHEESLVYQKYNSPNLSRVLRILGKLASIHQDN